MGGIGHGVGSGAALEEAINELAGPNPLGINFGTLGLTNPWYCGCGVTGIPGGVKWYLGGFLGIALAVIFMPLAVIFMV